MTQTKITYTYTGFGISIVSELPLPELTEIDSQKVNTDLEIIIQNLSNVWDKVDLGSRKKFVVRNNTIMFEVPDTGIFFIQEGQRIIVSPIPGVEEGKIRLYVLGTCMGAALIQKKILPLHGSALAINGKAYAFVGYSGAGKSTLATELIRNGFSLMSDDIIPLKLSTDGLPYVSPTYPQQKLWQESLNHFGMEATHYRPLFERETKYTVPVSANFTAEPLPLAGVFELVKTDHGQVTIQKVENLERLKTLYEHTFRNVFIPRLGLQDWHFMESSRILNHIKVFKLYRPSDKFTVNQLSELILNTIGKEEN